MKHLKVYHCKLNKAIYSLKQAARAENIKIGKSLKRMNFVQSTDDPDQFVWSKGENMTNSIVFVDDSELLENMDQ